MEINSIANGIVIDHLHAGSGAKVLEYLNVDPELGSIALIMNVASRKYGKKDLIKFENLQNVDVEVLGLIDHQATVIHIKDEKIVKKVKLELPKKVTNVLICKNPRCVTSVEAVPHVFMLADNSGKYSCEYCNNLMKFNEQ